MWRALLLLLATAIAVLYAGFQQARALLEPASGEARPEIFEIRRGDSLGAVVRRLEERGLIKSALATKLAARYERVDGKLHIGEYELSPHLSSLEILDVITTGKVKTYAATLPEGSRASEIAQRLEVAGLVDAEAFMKVIEDPEFVASLGLEGRTLEGYLYPDTYNLPRGLSPQDVARAMVHEFERVWTLEIEPLAVAHPLSKSEIVTLASIVEKETAAPEERPLIAAVFLNRLRKDMRLETDPTVIYGIKDFDGNIKKRHLLDRSNPYNTYRIKGLPPGPISSPGSEALRAVVRPAETDYLYFVSQNDGTHYFSSTYREHTNAVNRYQKRRRSRISQ